MMRARLAIGFMLLTLPGTNNSATASTNYFTEYFYGDYDLGGYTMTFEGVGGPDFYAVTNVSEITELPASPNYGYTPTYYSLDDWDVRFISVPGGNSIKLYGNSYNSFYLFSDGFMTFGTNWYNTAHFSSPHISPYYADLNPAAGGTVSAGELYSGLGFVVTFEDVPRWGNTNVLCTFQCIMLYGAGGAVQMSWLHASDPGSVIVGLSRGDGVPVGATETDLSSYFFTGDPNDMDADGLPDWWENFYFDSYTNCAPDGHGDTDGYDNESEYIAGTIPNDASSFFTVGYSMGSSQMLVYWNSLTGRTYSVQHTDLLTSPFTNLAAGLVYPQNSYTSPVDSQDSGFFKVNVQMTP